jgi:uncharacterized membrane protein YdbT with pleckstrin-like domain
MKYPEHLLTEGEEIIREFRPHWRMLVVPIAWGLLGIALIVLTWRLAPTHATVDWIVTGLVVIGVFKLSVYPLISWFFTGYVLTSERLVWRRGVLARKGIEIPLENINDVQFSQTILERVLRSGDLLIESAGERGQSRFGDIPNPEAFQSLIYRVREERSVALNRGPTIEPSDSTTKLERLGRLLKDGLISQEEFEEAKAKLLDEL